METKLLQVVFVIDESGSMQGSNADVIGGFNSYIKKHCNVPKARVNVSLYKFNHLITKVISNKPVKEVTKLKNRDYTPNGFTALFDAIGKAISETDQLINSLPDTERPSTITMVIITDGQENASQEYSATAVKSAIATHEKMLNWQFIYLGADLDNFADAVSLNISKHIRFSKKNMSSKFDIIADAGIMYSMSGAEEMVTDKLMDDLEY